MDMSAVQSQKAVSAYFTSEQILPFGLAEQMSDTDPHLQPSQLVHCLDPWPGRCSANDGPTLNRPACRCRDGASRHHAVSCASGPVFSYKLRIIVGFWLVEMAISTNQKPTIYRNLYENTDPGLQQQQHKMAGNSRNGTHNISGISKWKEFQASTTRSKMTGSIVGQR